MTYKYFLPSIGCFFPLCAKVFKFDIVKMFMAPKIIYRFNTIHITIPMEFFAETEKKYPKHAKE